MPALVSGYARASLLQSTCNPALACASVTPARLRALFAVEHDGAVHDAGVAGEAALPQSMTDEDDARPAWPVFFRQEHTSQGRFRAEHREQVLGDAGAFQFFRIASARTRFSGQVEDVPFAARSGCGGVLENLRLRFPIGVVSGSGCVTGEARLADVFEDRDQPLRVA